MSVNMHAREWICAKFSVAISKRHLIVAAETLRFFFSLSFSHILNLFCFSYTLRAEKRHEEAAEWSPTRFYRHYNPSDTAAKTYNCDTKSVHPLLYTLIIRIWLWDENEKKKIKSYTLETPPRIVVIVVGHLFFIIIIIIIPAIYTGITASTILTYYTYAHKRYTEIIIMRSYYLHTKWFYWNVPMYTRLPNAQDILRGILRSDIHYTIIHIHT